MVSRRRRLASVATIGALGACCLAAVGCSSGSSSGAPDPLANQTGVKVAAEAIADMKAAPGLTIYSTGIASGQYATVYMGLVPGKGCTGMVMQGYYGDQGTLTYITIGETVYFKPDSTMWQLMAGSNAATITQRVGGRYVKDPVSDRNLQGLGNCAIANPQAWAGDVAKGQVTTLNGAQVLPLTNSRGDVMFVTDTSQPEIVQRDLAPVPGTTDPAQETTFTIGAPVKLIAPAATQVLSGASIHL